MVALRKKTLFIVIHCAATRPSQNVGVADIRRWHKEKGYADIGYHYVIRRSGLVEPGRKPDTTVGAGVQGYNHSALHLCMVGGLNEDTWKPEDNFTEEQWHSLRFVVSGMVKKFPGATVLGHRDFPKVAKACPCFDARKWAKREGFVPAPLFK